MTESWVEPIPNELPTVTGPAPVLVSIAPAARQQRLTVAFRAILVIPHLFAVWLIGIGAEVVAFIGWWAALFTGQLPEFAHTFVTGYVRWAARVSAYGLLLTDRYPPFDLEDSDYPVRVVTKPTRLNRLAVLFRVVLIIPAAFVGGTAVLGATIVSPIAWLISLITGRMPDPLHHAFGAIVRYTARYTGYLLLVTPEYPWGLYGDEQPAAPLAALATAGPAAPPADEVGTLAGTAEWAETPAEPASAFDPWRLVLSSSARALVTVCLVLGVAGYAAYIALIVALSSSSVNNTVARENALIVVGNDYNSLGTVFQNFQTQTQQCGGNLGCVTALDKHVASSLQEFAHGLQRAGVPSQFAGQLQTVTAETSKVSSDFARLGTAQSAAQYQSIVAGMNITTDVNQFQSTVNRLVTSLTRG